jgi:glycosyltransferase involved in cell wall biosynthesis
MPAPLLSVILIARNEATRIEACLASVAFADEWIVVDSASSDDTAERARRLGAQVFDFPGWPGFGAQKQRALDRALGRWVLAIDADERSRQAGSEHPQGDLGRGGARGLRTVACRAFAAAGSATATGIGPGAAPVPPRRGRFSPDRVHERVVVEGDGPIGRLEGDCCTTPCRPSTTPWPR